MKACLYFFAILVYYCVYRILIRGSFQADIIIMAEMILTTYIMGYVQVYLLRNFEESEKLGLFQGCASLGCSLFYGLESYVLSWFDRSIGASLIYVVYMLVCYLSVMVIYYVMRQADTEKLNRELDEYKRRENT